MKTISQYQERLKELSDGLGTIKQNCIHEKRDPSKEERLAMKNMMDEVKEVEDIIATLRQTQETIDRLNTPEERQVPPEQATAGAAARTDGQTAQERFATFGEFLSTVMRADMPGGYSDPRLRLETRAATGMGEAVPSDGGYLVQSDFAAGILREAFETGVLARLCRRIPISSGSNRLEINGIDETSRVDGSRWGGIRAYWADEASEKTKSAPKFRKIKLKLNKLIGLCYATDELLDDVTALEGVIRQGFASEFGFKIDDAIINGTGAGMPLGIINAGCLVSQAKESAQTADTVVYNNVLKMWARLFAASRSNSVWLINQDVEPQLAIMSVDGSGNSPIYMPPGGPNMPATSAPYSTLFGRPVIPIEQCATIGDTGDIYLCDFSNYILAEKGGIQADMSIHVRSTKWAAHGSDTMINSSLIRGNLNRKARQSRASRDSNVRQLTESRASVETLQELPLAA